nr:hypothetical protein [uncultured Bdellovibrio sp.]
MLWANLSLVAAGFSLALAVGGGFYEGFVINPQWSLQPPTSFTLIQEGTGVPLQKFWIPVHILITVFILVALFLNWRIASRRTFLLISLGSYVIMRGWSFLYFIPEMLSFQKIATNSPPSEELMNRVSTWKTLTYWRTPLDLISFFTVLWSLTLDE